MYEHALGCSRPDEIAEAFAADPRGRQPRPSCASDDEGATAATCSRSSGRSPPHRDEVRIQRWSLRRVGLTVTALLALLFVLGLIVSNWAVFA